MLDTIGVSEHLPEPGCPIRTIEVADGLEPGRAGLRAGRGRRAARAGCTRTGICAPRCWRGPRPGKQSVAAVEGEGGDRSSAATHGVTRRAGRTGGSSCAPLLVAAEGRNSPTREAAGIRVARWKYDHAAIVSTLRHERPHDNVAYEIFYPAGPFALLPMTDDADGHRSAIVWSVPKDDAPAGCR